MKNLLKLQGIGSSIYLMAFLLIILYFMRSLGSSYGVLRTVQLILIIYWQPAFITQSFLFLNSTWILF